MVDGGFAYRADILAWSRRPVRTGLKAQSPPTVFFTIPPPPPLLKSNYFRLRTCRACICRKTRRWLTQQPLTRTKRTTCPYSAMNAKRPSLLLHFAMMNLMFFTKLGKLCCALSKDGAPFVCDYIWSVRKGDMTSQIPKSWMT